MFSIGKNLHIIHMTGDVAALDAWYKDVFSVACYMPVNYEASERRDASLVLVGDLCIEPMAPAFNVAGWEEFPLGRFYNRFGQRWHSLAWSVPTDEDLVGLYRTLKTANLRLFGMGGSTQDGEDPTLVVFTHPRDTCTQLQFMSGDGFDADPRRHPAYNPGWWSRQHPLGITNSSHVTIAVRDVKRACQVYVELLGGRLMDECQSELTETQSAFVAVGTDLIVELAQPLNPTCPLGLFLAEFNEGLHAVTFQVRDLSGAEEYLSSKGVKVDRSDEATFLTDPATTHGAVMVFTTRRIPGDLRTSWEVHPS